MCLERSNPKEKFLYYEFECSGVTLQARVQVPSWVLLLQHLLLWHLLGYTSDAAKLLSLL